jgi:hypothetical protein
MPYNEFNEWEESPLVEETLDLFFTYSNMLSLHYCPNSEAKSCVGSQPTEVGQFTIDNEYSQRSNDTVWMEIYASDEDYKTICDEHVHLDLSRFKELIPHGYNYEITVNDTPNIVIFQLSL